MKIKELIIAIILFIIGLVIGYLEIFNFENRHSILRLISISIIGFSSKRIIEILIEGKRFYKFKKINFKQLDNKLNVIDDIDIGLIFSYTKNKLLISRKTFIVTETIFLINNKENKVRIKIDDFIRKDLDFTQNTTITLQFKSSTFFSGPRIILSIIIDEKLYDIFRLRKPFGYEYIEIQNFIEEKISWILDNTTIKYKAIIEN